MKIGIIGVGNIGSGLGRLWAQQGHDVVYGVRNLEDDKAKAAVAASPASRAASVNEAAEFGEVVVLAVPWQAAEDTIKQAGKLEGKVLVDCTNAVGMILPTSAAETIAGWAHGAKVVKAFNTLGAPNLGDLQFGNLRADTFIAGDDAEAKKTVTQLAQDAGFEVVDCGPLANAKLVEALAMLWITLAYRLGNGPKVAFKLLRK